MDRTHFINYFLEQEAPITKSEFLVYLNYFFPQIKEDVKKSLYIYETDIEELIKKEDMKELSNCIGALYLVTKNKTYLALSRWASTLVV